MASVPASSAATEEQIVARRDEIDPGTGYAAPVGDIETRLARLWQAALSIDKAGRNDNFFDLGGDSFQAIDLLIRVEKEFHVVLPPSTIIDHSTLRKFAALLAGNAKAASARVVVPLQAAGFAPPLFFVHEASGNVFSYQALVRHMGQSRQIYGLIYPGQDLDPIPALSVIEMAEIYVGAIKSIQPIGPYLLVGYSFGGTAAYEIARQLRESGDEIGLLVIVDGGTRDGEMHGAQRLVRKLSRHLAVMADAKPSRWAEYIWGALRREMDSGKLNPLARLRDAKKIDNVPKKMQILIGDTLVGARDSYLPLPYDGKVKILRCTQGIAARHGFRHLGWADHVKGGIEIYDLPTDHYTALSEPVVALVAAHLQQWLAQMETLTPPDTSAF